VLTASSVRLAVPARSRRDHPSGRAAYAGRAGPGAASPRCRDLRAAVRASRRAHGGPVQPDRGRPAPAWHR